ncbi:unnamed protein product [Discosporangium mesarthrocarpum]
MHATRETRSCVLGFSGLWTYLKQRTCSPCFSRHATRSLFIPSKDLASCSSHAVVGPSALGTHRRQGGTRVGTFFLRDGGLTERSNRQNCHRIDEHKGLSVRGTCRNRSPASTACGGQEG